MDDRGCDNSGDGVGTDKPRREFIAVGVKWNDPRG